MQKSVLHEIKYHHSKIKVAFCTHFLWLQSENLALFCTRALQSCKKVLNFHSVAIKKFVQKSTSFIFFKQKTAYEMLRSLVGSEMCIRDSPNPGCKHDFPNAGIFTNSWAHWPGPLAFFFLENSQDQHFEHVAPSAGWNQDWDKILSCTCFYVKILSFANWRSLFD